MFHHVLDWDALHPVDFDFGIVAPVDGVRDAVDVFLVHLHAVDGQPRPRKQLLVANVAFEVTRFLML